LTYRNAVVQLPGTAPTAIPRQPANATFSHEITREYQPRPFTILDRRFTRCRQSWRTRRPADSRRVEGPAVPARAQQNRL